MNDGRWVNDTQASKYNFISEFSIENCVIDVIAEPVKAKATPEPIVEKTKAVKATTKPVAEPVAVKAKATKTAKAKKA